MTFNDQLTPLTNLEFDWLDDFLLDRISDDADTQDKDEGILDMSELDGYFTAIVSGPGVIQPSKWLPHLWGDFEPEWQDEKQFERAFNLMVRHMNEIVAALMQQADDFEPAFTQRIVKGKTYIIVDEWCEGFMRGVSLWEAIQRKDVMETKILLTPIRAFTHETNWAAHDRDDALETDNIRKAITPNVRQIHAYWLARREDYPSKPQGARHTAPRIGRNDPCSCGSGKKFKKCCLH